MSSEDSMLFWLQVLVIVPPPLVFVASLARFIRSRSGNRMLYAVSMVLALVACLTPLVVSEAFSYKAMADSFLSVLVVVASIALTVASVIVWLTVRAFGNQGSYSLIADHPAATPAPEVAAPEPPKMVFVSRRGKNFPYGHRQG